jgi:hypothetical protein
MSDAKLIFTMTIPPRPIARMIEGLLTLSDGDKVINRYRASSSTHYGVVGAIKVG